MGSPSAMAAGSHFADAPEDAGEIAGGGLQQATDLVNYAAGLELDVGHVGERPSQVGQDGKDPLQHGNTPGAMAKAAGAATPDGWRKHSVGAGAGKNTLAD